MNTIYYPIAKTFVLELKIVAETEFSYVGRTVETHFNNEERLFEKSKENKEWFRNLDDVKKHQEFLEQKELRKAELLDELEKEFA